MANENHEQYGGNDICTYTDLITIGNTLTTAQVDACILAAGEAPADNPKKIYLDNKASQPGPNSFSPFYFLDPDLWYSEEELVDAKGTWYNYLHTVYASTQQNALATQLKVDNYRNFVSITEYTETINGTPHKYYGLSITTKYGDNNDDESTWTNSILKPMYVLAEGDARTGIFLDEIMCKQEYNFTNSWGSMCTDLGFIQGRRNLKDNESGGIIPYGIWQSGLAPQAYHIEGGHQYGDSYEHHLQWQNNPSSFYTASVYNNIDDLLFIVAIGGLMFEYNNKLYKPIVENGVVVGYTDDLTKTSEWDEWEDIGDHEIPVTPPVSPDDDDPSDDQSWGGAYSGAGAFSKFYLCTATDLANLRTWFGGGGGGDPIPDGFDPMGQVLGLLQYPISISGTALSPDEITFRSGKTIVHTGVNADRSTGGFLHLDCGSVEIPRRMQERGVPFLDFETTLEIYVPFCGTAPLDVQTCVGKTLTCDMYVATATGDVSAVIAAGGHPVAYMSGNMAESLPISSSGYGMYLAACKSTWGNGVSQVMNQLTGGTTSTIKNVNQAALNETLSYSQTGGWGHSELLAESYNNPVIGRGMAGAASAKGAAAIGLTTTALNVANAASTGYEQYQRVKNASYTSVSGSFTSCAAWNYPFTPYVKITRPHKQIPDNYKHTAAIPLVETRSLSGAPGLTTCVNPDVSGIANATAQEKDIIYRALVNGVIV